MKIGYNINGNKRLYIKGSDLPAGSGRGFSIQTLYNLPETDRNGVCSETLGEVKAYVDKHGTARQRRAFGIK